MNTDLANAAVCYGLYNEKNEIIGFCGILHQPHGYNPNIKRVSRLVILPDYQGIGLGKKFLNILAEMYSANGKDFSITTSACNMIAALKNDERWIMTRYGVNRCASKKSAIDYKRKSMRTNCKTATFFIKKIRR